MADLDPTTLDIYRQAAQRRRQLLQEQVKERRERACEVARLAAETLRTEFQVTKVVAFGSLVVADQFHHHSDVDLAVWGLEERVYFLAVGRLQSLDPAIGVDLILFEDAKPALQAAIQRDGVAL